MGRNGSGAYTTDKCRKLDLGWLLKNKYILKGKKVKGELYWMDGSEAGFESCFSANEKYLRIQYTITKRNGEKIHYDYMIQLVTVPSNLGKGEILYFECPESGKRARILYSAYGHDKYIHRDWYLEKYGKRVYYNSQLCSKYDYHNTRYHTLDRKINDLLDELFNAKHRKMHYKGKPTKDFQRLTQMGSKRLFHENKRNNILTHRLGIHSPQVL